MVTLVLLAYRPSGLGAWLRVRLAPAQNTSDCCPGTGMPLMSKRCRGTGVTVGARLGVGTAVGARLVGLGVAVGTKVGPGVAVGTTDVGLGGGTAVGATVGVGGSVGAGLVGMGFGKRVGSNVGPGVAVGTGVVVGVIVGCVVGAGDGGASGAGAASGSSWLASSPGEGLVKSHISEISANAPIEANNPKEYLGPRSDGPAAPGPLSQEGRL